MLRTTDPTTDRAPAPPVLPDGTDPLLRLEYETKPATGPGATRCLSHPHELAFGGIPATCTACRARRDWMLINHGRNVWIRCRCSNQWLEPELSRADFDAMIDSPDVTNYSSVELEPLGKALNSLATGLNLTVRNVTTHTRDELTEQEGMERLARVSLMGWSVDRMCPSD